MGILNINMVVIAELKNRPSDQMNNMPEIRNQAVKKDREQLTQMLHWPTSRVVATDICLSNRLTVS